MIKCQSPKDCDKPAIFHIEYGAAWFDVRVLNCCAAHTKEGVEALLQTSTPFKCTPIDPEREPGEPVPGFLTVL